MSNDCFPAGPAVAGELDAHDGDVDRKLATSMAMTAITDRLRRIPGKESYRERRRACSKGDEGIAKGVEGERAAREASCEIELADAKTKVNLVEKKVNVPRNLQPGRILRFAAPICWKLESWRKGRSEQSGGCLVTFRSGAEGEVELRWKRRRKTSGNSKRNLQASDLCTIYLN